MTRNMDPVPWAAETMLTGQGFLAQPRPTREAPAGPAPGRNEGPASHPSRGTRCSLLLTPGFCLGGGFREAYPIAEAICLAGEFQQGPA